MVRAYLLSFVARQAVVLEKKVAGRFPNSWLVWEPGAWSTPPAKGEKVVTRVTSGGTAFTAPQAGDALCFELAPPASTDELRLGRAESNDIVIEDITVSREHLVLARQGDGRWSARALEKAKASFIDSSRLKPGRDAPLADGQKLKLGEVVFTFHGPASLLGRAAAMR